MILTKPRAITAALLMAGALTAALPGSPALAYISGPLVLLGQAESPSHLVAGGSAIDITVEYSCTATNAMQISVTVTEAVTTTVASGSGTTEVRCDSQTHRTLVRVPSTTGGSPFAKGKAVVDTSVYGEYTKKGQNLTGYDTTSRTIKIKD